MCYILHLFYDTINAIKRCNVNELYGGACFVYTTLVKWRQDFREGVGA